MRKWPFAFLHPVILIIVLHLILPLHLLSTSLYTKQAPIISTNLGQVLKMAHTFGKCTPAETVDLAKDWLKESRAYTDVPEGFDPETIKKYLAYVEKALQRIEDGVDEGEYDKLVSLLDRIIRCYIFERNVVPPVKHPIAHMTALPK
ncbi:hypothetical protein BJY00DRAFT_318761 [Aspergillus carlsbadensis]|nr:hypothetical protein BJY00DRAFT_318761 [Aspergillus carlsbadensis]